MTEREQAIIAAVEAARDEMGAEGELFDFYTRLLRLLAACRATLPPPDAARWQRLAAAWEPTQGQPALRWPDLTVPTEGFHAWFLEVAHLFEARDPGVLDEAEAVEGHEVLTLAERWFEEGTTGLGSTVDALLGNALSPWLYEASDTMTPHLPLGKWDERGCPLCGGYPDFALGGDEGTTLLCERCGTEWQTMREGCLLCGEEDGELLGYYSTQDEVYRVAVCDGCGGYLKGMNRAAAAQQGLAPLLRAERLLTPGLDLLAAQEGFVRPQGRVEE